MPAHQEYQSVSYLKPRYEINHDVDGDMLFLENELTGEAFVLCGSNEEIYNFLENTISHIVFDKVNRMKPVQKLVQQAFDAGLFRYAPEELPWSNDGQTIYDFELRRTFGSGVEFCYDLAVDKIRWATQSIDGYVIPPDEFLKELEQAVADADSDAERLEETKRSAKEFVAEERARELKRIAKEREQPCQQYAQARGITEEEPYVTEHNDEKPFRWLVTQVHGVEAKDNFEAIERVNEMHSSCELVSQDAELAPVRYRVGIEHFVVADNAEHALEQFHNIAQTDPDIHDVNVLREEP